MSSRDKTREKLMGSMRKTKAIAGIGGEQVGKKTANTGPAEAKPVRSTPRKVIRDVPSRRTGMDKADPYQSGRRVWPD